MNNNSIDDTNIPTAGSVAARHRAGNPRLRYEHPAPPGWPRSILDGGSPRRTMVLRQPTREYQPDRASRTACRTATHPADHTPQPTSANAPDHRPRLDNHHSISAAHPHRRGVPPARTVVDVRRRRVFAAIAIVLAIAAALAALYERSRTRPRPGDYVGRSSQQLPFTLAGRAGSPDTHRGAALALHAG